MKAMSKTSVASSLLLGSLSLVSVSGRESGGCLDFLDLSKVPKCYQGAFLCLGPEDGTCHKAENQLVMHVNPKGWDARKDAGQFGFRLENEGPEASRIQSVWVEDEYKLLQGYYSVAPIETSKGQKYRVLSNASVFSDALAHHVPFDQHFVASCGAQDWVGNSIRRGLRNVAGAATGSASSEVLSRPCVENSGATGTHDYVTINFDSKCSLEDLEEAISLGLIRVGVQMTGFNSRPSTKGLITCQDLIEVEEFDASRPKGQDIQTFEFDEDEFWEDGDEDLQHHQQQMHEGHHAQEEHVEEHHDHDEDNHKDKEEEQHHNHHEKEEEHHKEHEHEHEHEREREHEEEHAEAS